MGTLVWSFARAVWWGSLAGAAPFMALFTIPLALSDMGSADLPGLLLLIMYPLLITGAIVIGASLLIGLPLTAVLSQSGRERQRDYALAGLLAGGLLPSLIMLLFGAWDLAAALWFTVPGMIAGTVTGLVWGKWREALADEAASADA